VSASCRSSTVAPASDRTIRGSAPSVAGPVVGDHGRVTGELALQPRERGAEQPCPASSTTVGPGFSSPATCRCSIRPSASSTSSPGGSPRWSLASSRAVTVTAIAPTTRTPPSDHSAARRVRENLRPGVRRGVGGATLSASSMTMPFPISEPGSPPSRPARRGEALGPTRGALATTAPRPKTACGHDVRAMPGHDAAVSPLVTDLRSAGRRRRARAIGTAAITANATVAGARNPSSASGARPPTAAS
jgi:hypothetical protein